LLLHDKDQVFIKSLSTRVPAQGFVPHVGQEAPQMETIVNLVAGGMGSPWSRGHLRPEDAKASRSANWPDRVHRWNSNWQLPTQTSPILEALLQPPDGTQKRSHREMPDDQFPESI
jgi:hypothetical protein